jgi:uncharacterized protein YkwD
MYRSLLFVLGIFAISISVSTAQVPPARQAVKVLTGYDISDFDRPRIVDERRAAAVGSSVIVNTANVERAAFQLLNQKRAENGLEPLLWNEQVASVARVHSRNMAEFQFFSHRGLDNKLVSHRADDLKIGKWRSIGENIAYNRGYADPVEKAVDLWLNSSTHRQNLLNIDWKESAVGVAIADDGSYYFTQVFLRK